jgi:Flp pilus assembly protein TadD
MRFAFIVLVVTSLSACAGSRDSKSDLSAAMPPPAVMAADAEGRGDWAGAARHWERAAAAAPEDRSVLLHAVHALRRSNACGHAQDYLQRLQSKGAESVDVLLESAKCHLISGRYEAAETGLSTAISLAPKHWEAESMLGLTYDLMERPSSALPHHDRAALLAPANPMVLSNKAMSLALGGDIKAALGVMRRAAAEPRAGGRIRMNLAFLEAVAGNGEVAAMMVRQEGAADAESAKLLQRIADAARNTQGS